MITGKAIPFFFIHFSFIMKFYEIDNALQEAIAAGDKPVRLRIEIQAAGHFESVFEQDIAVNATVFDTFAFTLAGCKN
jgi:hypothetical protein